MKRNYLLVAVLLIHSVIFSQIGPRQIITSAVDQPQNVTAADIDGDGDLDVLSSNQLENSVAWFENLDGDGNFGVKQVITNEALECQWVHTSDIDGDGDLDVLSASWVDNKIAWYENLDGSGAFGSQQIISDTAIRAESVATADIDGDGDMDVISASRNDGDIIWYNNLNGDGNFDNGTIINTNLGAVFALPADLDNDGDIDIVACSGTDNVHWNENLDGEGNFGPSILITDIPSSAFNLSIGDIDGDGDLDVAIIALNDATIYWAENTDGEGNFNLAQTITTSMDVGYSVELIDIDDDDDLDLFVAYGNVNPSAISWCENTDGLGAYGQEQLIDSSISFPTAVTGADLNGDGQQDLLVSAGFDDELIWYENLFPLSINDENILRFTLFPIPTSGILNISSSEEIDSISIYAISGKKILEDSYEDTIDLSTLSSGIYVLQVTTASGRKEMQRIIKQ